MANKAVFIGGRSLHIGVLKASRLVTKNTAIVGQWSGQIRERVTIWARFDNYKKWV